MRTGTVCFKSGYQFSTVHFLVWDLAETLMKFMLSLLGVAFAAFVVTFMGWGPAIDSWLMAPLIALWWLIVSVFEWSAISDHSSRIRKLEDEITKLKDSFSELEDDRALNDEAQLLEGYTGYFDPREK
jgi:hypothetical protein